MSLRESDLIRAYSASADDQEVCLLADSEC
jgi:hypothetical protein